MNDVKDLLKVELESQFGSLAELDYGSTEHKLAVEDTAKLLDKYNDMVRIELDHQDKIESRKMEKDLKLKELGEEKKDHLIKNCLTAGTAIGGGILTVWGIVKSLEFEEKGTITTIVGRGLFNKILPKK